MKARRTNALKPIRKGVIECNFIVTKKRNKITKKLRKSYTWKTLKINYNSLY